jgi:hypothetical protein
MFSGLRETSTISDQNMSDIKNESYENRIKGLTSLDHGYDDAQLGHVHRGPPCLLYHPCLCHDLDHPDDGDLSPYLCLSPDFFLCLCPIRENDAAPQTTSQSNERYIKGFKKSSALYNFPVIKMT